MSFVMEITNLKQFKIQSSDKNVHIYPPKCSRLSTQRMTSKLPGCKVNIGGSSIPDSAFPPCLREAELLLSLTFDEGPLFLYDRKLHFSLMSVVFSGPVTADREVAFLSVSLFKASGRKSASALVIVAVGTFPFFTGKLG